MDTGIIKELSSPMEPIETGLNPRLEKLSGLRAVVFDIYGTLFISDSWDISMVEKRDHEEAIREALGQSGFSIRDHSVRISKRFTETIRAAQENRCAEDIIFPEVEIRHVWREFLLFAKSESVLSGEVSDQSIEKLALHFECLTNPVWPMPGLQKILSDLHARGLLLGIVSNAQFYTPPLFEVFLGNNLEELGFATDCCVWSYRELEAKPSVRLFNKVAQAIGKRGIEPGQTLYVGNDMLNDIQPAGQAGFRTALFVGDRRSLRLHEEDDQLKKCRPDVILTLLNQIPDCLG